MSIKQTETVNALEATKFIWDTMTFGGLLRSIRLSDDLSQAQLAEQLQVSRQFLSDVEHNRKDVGITFAKKVASALDYSIEPFIELLLRDQLKRHHLNYYIELKKVS